MIRVYNNDSTIKFRLFNYTEFEAEVETLKTRPMRSETEATSHETEAENFGHEARVTSRLRDLNISA